MEWISLASTALGAIIALCTTLINERFKWRREQLSSHRRLRHQTYSSFLSALTDAHERMRGESTADHTPESRSAAVLQAFREANCYGLRYELAIIAEQDVLDSAERAFTIMRDIRDVLAEGASTKDDRYTHLRSSYGTALRELQHRVRTELASGRVRLTGGS